jgi:hypothetical protein
MLCNFTRRSMREVTMNSIRALNVRTRIEEIPGRHPSPEADNSTPSSYIAPFNPAAQPVPEEPATASSCKAASTP